MNVMRDDYVAATYNTTYMYTTQYTHVHNMRACIRTHVKTRVHYVAVTLKERTASRANDTLETYLPTYKHATTKICIMYTRLLKPFYQICHYLIISVVF